MCAIVGWQLKGAEAQDRALLDRMAKVMRHRGPDDSGEYRDPASGIALAHRRLSIIDLSQASHQPMIDPHHGVALIYNGELYNFRDLRDELKGSVTCFSPPAIPRWSCAAIFSGAPARLARFAGMFAFAIWDPGTQILHLARDAMGMKPLYYLTSADGIVFASELKAFRELPGFVAQADLATLQQYLEFGYVFDENRTMLRAGCASRPGRSDGSARRPGRP